MRATTLIQLRGPGGETGRRRGRGLRRDRPREPPGRRPEPIDLAGSYTLDSFSKRLEETALFPAPPVRGEVSELYRRWAFESAALDLALAQAGRSLADVLEREPRPLNFVVSMRLGSLASRRSPRSRTASLRLLERYPGTKLKLDPTNNWTQELVDAARGHRRGRLARPQGPVQGHAGGRGDRPGALPHGHRGVPERVARGPGRDRRDAAAPRRGERARDLGRADPLGGRRARPSLEAAHGEHQAVALRPAQQPVRDVRLVRAGGGTGVRRRPDRARARAAATSSTSHRSSTRTPRTTRRPPATTSPQLPDGLLTSPLEPRIAPAGFRWQQ